MRHVQTLLAVCLLVLGLGLVPGPGRANAENDNDKAVGRIAAALASGIAGKARVAVRPLSNTDGGLPTEIGRRLDQHLMNALRRRAGHRLTMVARDGLAAAWDEVAEFDRRSLDALIAEARADVLVLGEVVTGTDGVVLSYRAVSLRRGSVGAVLAAPKPERIALADVDLVTLRFLQTLWRAADSLAEAAAPVVSTRASQGLEVARPDSGGAFKRYLASILTPRLQRGLRRKARPVAVPIGGGTAAVGRQVLHLGLEVWDHGDVVSVTLSLHGEGVSERRTARLAHDLIPAHFLPLTRDGGEVGTGMRAARGAAWSGPALPRRLALAGARALARARVVASALGATMPVTGTVRASDQTAALRRMMERGIPHDEVWSAEAGNTEGDVAVALRALVSPVGGTSAPRVGLGFAGRDFLAGDDLELTVTAKGTAAHVAVFSWHEDDGVVRLYPAGTGSAMRVGRSRTLVLPPPEGPRYGVAPMPGRRESWETLIVLASAVPLDVTDLATPPLEDPASSLHRARTASVFFDALARQDLSSMTIRILTYRVRTDG